MSDILGLIIVWGVSTALHFAVVRWDERRLSPEMLARAWPTATRRIALVYFPFAPIPPYFWPIPLALPVHFGRTRRSVLGVLQGLFWGLAILLVDLGVTLGLDFLMQRLGVE